MAHAEDTSSSASDPTDGGTPNIGSAVVPRPRVEVVSLRTADAKHFLNPDDTYTGVFGHNIHYRDELGRWQDVDLNFRPDGLDFVADRNSVIVRVGEAGVSAIARGSGRGVLWHTPERPAVAGRKASFESQGLVWTYVTTKSGIKLLTTVAAPRGAQTYSFSYDLIGTSTPLAVGNSGELYGDGFTIPRGVVVGADRELYETGPWRITGDGQIAFDFDDSTLPTTAFPYELDPSTTFSIAAGGDDGDVANRCASYPPTCGNTVATSNGFFFFVERSRDSNPTNPYSLQVALTRWNTSSIPDDAKLASVNPQVTVYVGNARNDNLRQLSMDWYTSWPIDTGDYTTTAQTSALGGQSLATFAIGATNWITLANHNGVSKTGYTGLRWHITGGSPTGINYLQLASYEHSVSPEPWLTVDYIPNTVPAVVSVSDDPDPVNSGGAVTWTMEFSDSTDDTVRPVICKTNAVSSTATCPGGAWATGGLTASSPATVSYTTTSSDTGVKSYYAFACDSFNKCSAATPGTFTVRPHIGSASASPTTVEVGGTTTFSASWSGSANSVRARVCKQSSECAFGSWAQGSLTSSSPATVSVTTTPADIGQYWTFISVCTSDGACSSSEPVFITVRDTPTITSVSDSPDPVSVGSPTTFAVDWTDSLEQVRAVICRTNAISGTTCPGGAWVVGELSAASPSTASYTATDADIGTQPYYAFACSATGGCSSSISGTLSVQDAAQPSQVTLTPASQTKNPGQSARVDVHVEKLGGGPLRNAAVQFRRSGTHPGGETKLTDSSGNTFFEWTGALEGADVVDIEVPGVPGASAAGVVRWEPVAMATEILFDRPVSAATHGTPVPVTFRALKHDGTAFVGIVRYGKAPAGNLPTFVSSVPTNANGEGAIEVTTTSSNPVWQIFAFADRTAPDGTHGSRDPSEALSSSAVAGSAPAGALASAVVFTTPVVQGPVGSTVVATFRALNQDGSPFVGTVRYGIGPASGGVPAQTQAVTLTASSNGQGQIPVVTAEAAQSLVAYADRSGAGLGSVRDATEVLGAAEAIGANVNAPPDVPVLVSPSSGYEFPQGGVQTFTANATDPDADAASDDNDYRTLITIRHPNGATATAFLTSSADSGENTSGAPVQPLVAGSYTWTAQAVDEKGMTSPESAARPFSVAAATTAGAPSASCDDGTHIAEGTVEANYIKLKAKQGASEVWFCYRLDRASPAIHEGGRLRLGAGGVGGLPSPVVDANDAYCAAQPGNVTEVNTQVGPANTPVRVDRFDNATEIGLCLRVGDTRARVSSLRASGLPVAVDEDSG